MAATVASQDLRLNGKIQLVPLVQMKVSDRAQQKFRKSWGDELAKDFDPDKYLPVECSLRDSYYYIVDGQHRIYAVKNFLGNGWEAQSVEAIVHTGLTERDEAELFLIRNVRKKMPSAMSKFRVAVHAGWKDETYVHQIVTKLGLAIGERNQANPAISAVSALLTVYQSYGYKALERSLTMIRDSWGYAGMDASVIVGVGMICQRYNGTVSDTEAIDTMKKVMGGVTGLLASAEQMRLAVRQGRPICVAAALVNEINRRRSRMKKLPPWFKEQM